MITYSKAFGSVPLVLRFRGSPLTRNAFWPCISVVMTYLLFAHTCRRVPEPFLEAIDGDDGADGEVGGVCIVKWCVRLAAQCVAAMRFCH